MLSESGRRAVAPDGRLERGDSGRGLFSALEQGLQDGLENIGVLAESQGAGVKEYAGLPGGRTGRAPTWGARNG